MPEQTDRRWHALVSISICGIIVTAMLVAVNIWLFTQRQADKASREAALIELRSSQTIIRNAEKERAARAASDKRNAQARCRGSITATKIANDLIKKNRDTLLDLAGVATNHAAIAKLRERAKTYRFFPLPKCDPGTSRSPTASSPSTQGGKSK